MTELLAPAGDRGAVLARELPRLHRALDALHGRWSVAVLVLLAERPHRFAELLRALDPIAPKVLAVTLRTLQARGLVVRGTAREAPYALSDAGGALLDALVPLARWDGGGAAA